MRRRKHPNRFWVPLDSTGLMWIRWANTNREKLVIELNEGFVGWRKSGIKIVRAKAFEIKRPAPRRERE